MKKLSIIIITIFLGIEMIASQKISPSINNENSLKNKFSQAMIRVKKLANANRTPLLVGLGCVGMSTGIGLWCWLSKKQGNSFQKNSISKGIINGSLLTKDGVNTLDSNPKARTVTSDAGSGVGTPTPAAKDLEPELSVDDIFDGECGTMVNDEKQKQEEVQVRLKKNADRLHAKNHLAVAKSGHKGEEKIENPNAKEFQTFLGNTEIEFDPQLIQSNNIELQLIDGQETLCYIPDGMKLEQEEALWRIFERWAYFHGRHNGSVIIRRYFARGIIAESTLKDNIYNVSYEEIQRTLSINGNQGFYAHVKHWFNNLYGNTSK